MKQQITKMYQCSKCGNNGMWILDRLHIDYPQKEEGYEIAKCSECFVLHRINWKWEKTIPLKEDN